MPEPPFAGTRQKGIASVNDGVYMVASLWVRDWEAIARYSQAAAMLVLEHGGEILGASIGSTEAVEGDPPDMLVVQRWPDRDAFDRFYSSDAYAPLKRLRGDAARTSIVFAPALRQMIQ